MKKQPKPQTPINLPNYPTVGDILAVLEDETVTVSDKVMRRYFGLTWKQYKRKNNSSS